MKKICEIYDISQEYEMKEKSVLICVSDLDKDKLFEILPELKSNFSEIFDNCEWQEYLEINKAYNRNESKHYMRETRQSKRVEADAYIWKQKWERNKETELVDYTVEVKASERFIYKGET